MRTTTTRTDLKKNNPMDKTFQVECWALIPAGVRVEVAAKDAAQAIRRAKERFDKSPRSCLRSGTEDYAAAHSFEAFEAEEQ